MSFSNFLFCYFVFIIVHLGYRHPCSLLLAKWRKPPALAECRVLANMMHDAIVNTGQARSRLRANSLSIVERQFDHLVSYYFYITVFSTRLKTTCFSSSFLMF